jgi:hypothetical protein
MNTIIKSLLAAIVLGAMTIQIQSQGYIVPNGVSDGGVTFWGAYQFNVVRDPATSFSTGFYLTPVGITQPSAYTNTYEFLAFVDVSVRVFIVQESQPIAQEPILANSYTELLFHNSYVFPDGVPFYLGLYTGNMDYYPPDGIYSDPLFGWAWVMNNHGAIQLLDGALAYQSQGIYAGTLDLIPEPSPHSLFGLGLLGMGLHRWCKGKLRASRGTIHSEHHE